MKWALALILLAPFDVMGACSFFDRPCKCEAKGGTWKIKSYIARNVCRDKMGKTTVMAHGACAYQPIRGCVLPREQRAADQERALRDSTLADILEERRSSGD